MKMDISTISTPLIFIGLFLVACLSLFFVYKYGIKEKSYEEALAEQRQQTSTLLGIKPKPKEKKNKKVSKKTKEKPILQENETDESEHIEHSGKLHVEFKDQTEEVPVKEVVQTKTKRVKKVRPILVNKDKSPEKVSSEVVDTPIINHFEENRPKDDFELLRSNSRDNIFKQEPPKEIASKDVPKEKVIKEKKQNSESSAALKNNKKSSKQPPPPAASNGIEQAPIEVVEKKVVEEKIIEMVTLAPQTNGLVGNPGKEKKKKKSEFNTRQQLSAERDGLINSVRKAELSKNEVQLLIDLLLNKQLEAPAVIGDWSEGKSDPIQKLKKQLADKEKALAEEQEALIGAQAKLKEVRAEQQVEKAQLQQKVRGFEELLQAKQIEIQANNNRLQVNTQKIQQLQAELNSEILKTHKLLEENQALQMQSQQFEVTVSQMQESEGIIAKMRDDIDELSAQNQQLRMEIQQSTAEKEHQHQLLVQQSEHNRQLKELQQGLERDLEIAMRQENDWKVEISNLNTAVQQQFEEKRRVELAVEQLKDELHATNLEKADCIEIIASLKAELQNLQEEQLSGLNGSSEQNKAQELKILNLNNELVSIKNELSSVRTELQKTEKRYKADLENSDRRCSTVEKELEEQKAKNNELRTKNWKVMEALNAAESRSKTSYTNKAKDVKLDDKAVQTYLKEFVQKLFPEIDYSHVSSSDSLHVISLEEWQAKYCQIIKKYIDSIKNQQETPPSSPEKHEDMSKLQAQLLHYKNIIDDTEGMLNKLQTHIESEELNWRNQLTAKQDELDHLKEVNLLQLQEKVSTLENQLSQERCEKNRILQECQQQKSHKPQAAAHSNATATIEKLSEEVNRLREQLMVEQTKNSDIYLKAQGNCSNSKTTNGSALIEGSESQP